MVEITVMVKICGKTMRALGAVIAAIRKDNGWRQDCVADRAGISKNYLSLIERGDRVPSIEVIENIARALQVPSAYLYIMADQSDDPIMAKLKELVEVAQKEEVLEQSI
jgi:transcriptional regulator with XRE-family HTH domain